MAGKGKPLIRPKRGKVIFGKDLWGIVDFINAIINGEIVAGKTYELIISDRKIIWKVKSSTSTGGGGSYRGEYAPDGSTPLGSGPFLEQDIVRVSPTNSLSVPLGGTIIPGVYVCIMEGAGLTDYPKHPLSSGGETSFWQLIATYPSLRQVCDEAGDKLDVFADIQDKPV